MVRVRDFSSFFDHEEDDYYFKPVGAENYQSNIYIEYGSNNNRSKSLSIEEKLNKIIPYVKNF